MLAHQLLQEGQAVHPGHFDVERQNIGPQP